MGVPLAYLITFRSYGTWLHGDARGAVNRFRNQYGTEFLPEDASWLRLNQRLLKQAPVILDAVQRGAVERAVRATCEMRSWPLHALNVRTNHVHTVVSLASKPPAIALNAFKGNATRQLRSAGLWRQEYSPWSDGGSKRYLWTEDSVARAVEYVINGQDKPLPEL